MSSELISAAELRHALGARNAPTLLDVRWRFAGPPGRADFAAGHLPGAEYVDLDTELCAAAGPDGRRPLPSPETFTAAMRRHAVSADRPVVVYDAAETTAAARAWWLLRYFGHRDVRVLDGGYRAWLDADHPIASGPDTSGDSDTATAPLPGDNAFTAVPGGLPTVDAEGAAGFAEHGILLDARPREQYLGEFARHGEPAGHIPGAVSAPAADNLTAEGRFRTPDRLRAAFAALGAVSPSPAIAVYCGAGLLAAQQVLALRIAGFDAALYPGSWSHWTRDPTRPIATGPAQS